MSQYQDMDDDGPDVATYLQSSLDVYQREHEAVFAEPDGVEQVVLHDAMQAISQQALEMVTSGRLPKDLADRLSSFQPGASIESKMQDLLAYNLVQHRIEFDVAWDVTGRLDGLVKRIRVTRLAFSVLLDASASETATKYFRKAARLFLAGYDTEVVVMCGAVLESALATRLDEELRAAGIAPRYKRTGDYSLGQRLDFEEKHPFFKSGEREMLLKVINWRNDAVHVQPDLNPPPEQPLVITAFLLPMILPRAVPL